MAPCDFGVMSVLHQMRVMTKMLQHILDLELRMSSRSIFVTSTRIAFFAIANVAVRLSYNDILRLNTPAVALRSPAPPLPIAKRYLVPFQVVPKRSPRSIILVSISSLRTTANASPAPPPPPPTASRAQTSPSGQGSMPAKETSSPNQTLKITSGLSISASPAS